VRITIYSFFSFLLFIIAGMMIFLSFNFNDKARFFPLLFGGVTIILVFFQLLSDCFSGVEKRLSFVRQQSVFDKLMKTGEEAPESDIPAGGSGLPLIRVFRIFCWLAALTGALYFLNYVAVSVVFIFLLIAVEAKAGWLRAVGVALCVGIFIYALFGVILRVNFQV